VHRNRRAKHDIASAFRTRSASAGRQAILATLGYVLSPECRRVLMIHRNLRDDDHHLGNAVPRWAHAELDIQPDLSWPRNC
jgi:hypothetical protein